MIIAIIGKQASGKTTLAKKIINYAHSHPNNPTPLLYDGVLTQENPSPEIMETLKIRELLGLITIITLQPMPDKSCLRIPGWLTLFKSKLFHTDDNEMITG